MVIRDGGAVNREATNNLVVASFQHGTSRAQDPQLHTHNVILNATTVAAKLRGEEREQALVLWKRKGKRAFEVEK